MRIGPPDSPTFAITVLAVVVVGIVACAQRTPAPKDSVGRDASPLLDEMFALAARRDIEALEARRTEFMGARDRRFGIAYALASYVAAPELHRRQFVATFPTESNDLMFFLYNQIELPGLTPRFLYSMESLGDLALAGDVEAMGKLVTAATHADGIVGEVLYEYVCRADRDATLRASYTRAVDALSARDAEMLSLGMQLCDP